MAQNGPCIDWLKEWRFPYIYTPPASQRKMCALLESPQSFAVSAALWGSSFPTSHAVASRRGKTWGRCCRQTAVKWWIWVLQKHRLKRSCDQRKWSKWFLCATSTHSKLEEMEFQFVTRSSGKKSRFVDWGCGQCLCVQGLLVQHDPTVQVTLTQRLQAPGCKHISKRHERNTSMIRWNKK